MLDNVLAWSAQVAVLVAVGALAAMTLAHPRARLIFWQGILAIALLLPAVEPWHQPAAEDTGAVAIAATAAPVTWFTSRRVAIRLETRISAAADRGAGGAAAPVDRRGARCGCAVIGWMRGC